MGPLEAGVTHARNELRSDDIAENEKLLAHLAGMLGECVKIAERFAASSPRRGDSPSRLETLRALRAITKRVQREEIAHAASR